MQVWFCRKLNRLPPPIIGDASYVCSSIGTLLYPPQKISFMHSLKLCEIPRWVNSGFRRDANENLCSSGILCSAEWQFCTDVPGQPIGTIFKGQAEDCLTLEDRTDRLSRNVCIELPFYAAWNRRRAHISMFLLIFIRRRRHSKSPKRFFVFVLFFCVVLFCFVLCCVVLPSAVLCFLCCV